MAPLDDSPDDPEDQPVTVVDPDAMPFVPGATTVRRPAARYREDTVLGRGGMGEVVLARDEQIGRDIAIKRMLDLHAGGNATARFLREARIQARLDHPAVVPVDDVDVDASGRPYFAMKRLTGTTMAQVLSGRAADDRATLQRLLRALVDVSRAVDFAHSRGVVHRDLKPDNIMLGDFGEVYVIDWGVARVLDQLGPERAVTDPGGADGTQAGAVIGTPGYMSPEQALGEAVERPADVYAVGAMLFETLAGTPLHPRGSAALATTVAGEIASPMERAPERGVPPELDELCRDATRTDPIARPTARQVAERIQRFLDGDRDLATRRRLAAQHLEAAHAARGDDPASRATALREAGRALALDPELGDAADLVTRLVLEPPKVVPPEVDRAIAAVDTELATKQARIGMLLLTAFLVFLPVMLASGVKSWSWVVLLSTAMLARFAAAWLDARWPSRWANRISVVVSAVTIAVVAGLFGPFIVTQGLACCLAVATVGAFVRTRPAIAVATILVGLVTPLVLQTAGAWPAPWSIVGGNLVSTSAIIELGSDASIALLIAAHVFMVIAASLFVHRLARERRTAHVQLEVHAWHLRQLLPAR